MMSGFIPALGSGFTAQKSEICPRGRRVVVQATAPPSRKGDEDGYVESARKALQEQLVREDDLVKNFDGYKLRELLQERWGYSYDIQLKGTPWMNGQTLVTVNIMWRYFEQQSFPLNQEDYLCNLEAITQYLKQWNAVQHFITYVRTTREKPRVGKAVAVPIDLTPEMVKKLEF